MEKSNTYQNMREWLKRLLLLQGPGAFPPEKQEAIVSLYTARHISYLFGDDGYAEKLSGEISGTWLDDKLPDVNAADFFEDLFDFPEELQPKLYGFLKNAQILASEGDFAGANEHLDDKEQIARYLEIWDRIKPAENITYPSAEEWVFYNLAKNSAKLDKQFLNLFAKGGHDEPGADTKYVLWISENDDKTCDECYFKDGRIYLLGDDPERPHLNCRCRKVYFDGDGYESGALQNNPEAPSNACISFIASYESFRAMPYKGQDSKNRTVGYGHVIISADGTKYDNGISQADALLLLKNDALSFTNQLNTFLRNNTILLTQNQYDALLSFTFNCGGDWIIESTLKNVLISGNFSKVGDAMMMWINVNGQESQGLINRRTDEVEMFYNADYNRNY